MRLRPSGQRVAVPTPAQGQLLHEDVFSVVDRAVTRMRLLAAVLFVVQSIADRSAGATDGAGVLPMAAAAAVAVTALTALSGLIVRHRGERLGRLLSALQHTGDTAAVVVAVAVSADNDVIWVLLVVPVLSGALRYRLGGALFTWGVIAAMHLAWLSTGGDGDDLTFLADLNQSVTRLAVVLLVALPAGYLSEHLLIEVRGLERAIAAAESRSGLLGLVAESGQRVNRLDDQVFSACLDAASGLGFSAVDLWERGEQTWQRLAATGNATSLGGLDPAIGDAVPEEAPLLVDGTTGDRAERLALAAAGLAAIVLVSVPGRRAGTVLRAAVPRGGALQPSQVECLQLLGRQAGVALRNGELVADLNQARADLEHQAFHDSLTGIANRALFGRRLAEAVAAAAASGATVGVLFCDLDRFKAVNDGLGHDVGNELLVAVTGRLSGCLRGDALLARVGGDEFTVLLPDVRDRAEVEQVAARMCEVLTQPFALAGQEVLISTSVGLVLSGPDCLDTGELLRRADVAMYRAKARGRACWIEWGQELEEATLSRLQLERDLRQAIDERALSVVFQPVLTRDGEVAGAETLVRWLHPRLGPVSPGEFIPIAEESSLIVDLGREVLRQAVAVAPAWLAGSDPRCFVSVNVSPRQLVSEGFADGLDALVAAAGLPSSRLLLEITEHAVTTGPEAVEALHDLAARGYRLALDDFGQGQTSLQHLRHFPLTTLKIDRGFVRDAGTDQRVRVIFRAIVELGRALELDVIAEGIESDAQRRAVTELGCTFLQGFGLGMPMDARELPAPATRLAPDSAGALLRPSAAG